LSLEGYGNGWLGACSPLSWKKQINMNWLDLLFIPVAIIYLMVVSALFVYGINFFYLALGAWRKRRVLIESSPVGLVALPKVTIQLPVYNEWYVAARLIEAATALDYPSELLQIQVLDDSTDETAPLIARIVKRLRADGIHIDHLHRAHRHGYKAGALADGLIKASGEFIAIFDADFVPGPDFLKRILPYFDSDRVAFVQARWAHLNREYSLLTLLQSLSIDAHFAVEQLARAQLGYWFNFNGTAGVWRKDAILDAGGWTAQTLTEDLDLSYRAFLRGWEARYAGEIEVPAELPVSFSAYRRQQHRWARGSFECAIRFVPLVWQSDAPLSRKIEATLHLTGYSVHLLLFALSVLYPIVILISVRYPSLISLFGIALLFSFTALAPTTYFVVGQHALGKRWLIFLPGIIFMTVLGAGMMLNTLRAAIQIWFGGKSAFERTPKYGITRRKQNWEKSRYQAKLDILVLFEFILAIFNLGTVWLSWRTSNWPILIYSALFVIGLFFTSGLTILQFARQRFFSGLQA
jgi:cellulose synthase/poly-beta-1,6-N-acetylglucosamine synthase-like glycosyltransferase